MADIDGCITDSAVVSAGLSAPEPGTIGGLIYRMRAFDTTLSRDVYWSTSTVDPTGTQYAGPGPLLRIVASHLIRTT